MRSTVIFLLLGTALFITANAASTQMQHSLWRPVFNRAEFQSDKQMFMNLFNNFLSAVGIKVGKKGEIQSDEYGRILMHWTFLTASSQLTLSARILKVMVKFSLTMVNLHRLFWLLLATSSQVGARILIILINWESPFTKLLIPFSPQWVRLLKPFKMQKLNGLSHWTWSWSCVHGGRFYNLWRWSTQISRHAKWPSFWLANSHSPAQILNGATHTLELFYSQYFAIEGGAKKKTTVCVCFCKDGLPDFSYQSSTSRVKKGESFGISLVAVDQVNHVHSQFNDHQLQQLQQTCSH